MKRSLDSNPYMDVERAGVCSNCFESVKNRHYFRKGGSSHLRGTCKVKGKPLQLALFPEALPDSDYKMDKSNGEGFHENNFLVIRKKLVGQLIESNEEKELISYDDNGDIHYIIPTWLERKALRLHWKLINESDRAELATERLLKS